MPKITVAVLLTHRIFFEAVQVALKDHPYHLVFGSGGDIQIIFDDSQGYLLHQLETLEPHPKRIYFSHNPCPEYLEYLSTFDAKAIVFNPSTVQIAQAVEAVANNQPFYQIPEPKANLTPQEKTIIRLVAEGKSQRQIGVLLGKSYGTIRNQLTKDIKPKLKTVHPDFDFSTDQHIARYYNGSMYLLRFWYLEARKPKPALELQENENQAAEKRLKFLMALFGYKPEQREKAIAFLAQINYDW